ncbi:hypothetical protein PAMA_020730 [Pampus argenteus]
MLGRSERRVSGGWIGGSNLILLLWKVVSPVELVGPLHRSHFLKEKKAFSGRWLRHSQSVQHECVWTCSRVSVVPLTIEMDLPEPLHFVLSSSRTAGLQERLQERLHEWLEERLGTGCDGPSPELCTASYRLSIDPS